MAPVELVGLARTLIDIDSTTGREAEAAGWVANWLRQRGYDVVEQPVAAKRFNVYATLDAPDVVLSTHIDCVPPFFSSREKNGCLYGRGACDAKGILAAQMAALDRLRESGERRVALLVVVGEEARQPRRPRRQQARAGFAVSHQRRADRQPARRRHEGCLPGPAVHVRTRGALGVSGAGRVGNRKTRRRARRAAQPRPAGRR